MTWPEDDFTRWLTEHGLTLAYDEEDLAAQTTRYAVESHARCKAGDHIDCRRIARAYDVPPWLICGAEQRPGRLGYMRWQLASLVHRARLALREGGRR